MIIEIRRKVGSFNQSHEITHANNHIQKITKSISELLNKSDDEVQSLQEYNDDGKHNALLTTILCLF